MRKTEFFSEQDLKRIEAAITEAEKLTRGEIVAMIVRASSDYRWVSWIWAGTGVTLASVALTAIEWRSQWSFSLAEIFQYQLLGALVGGALSLLRPLQRLVLTPGQTARRVHREALANFTASGLHETKDRSGILIYISELEKRVQIFADSGIHGHAGEPYWDKMVKEIVTGIGAGRPGDAVCHAIGRIGEKLAEHFPAGADHKNELSNEVRLGPADIK